MEELAQLLDDGASLHASGAWYAREVKNAVAQRARFETAVRAAMREPERPLTAFEHDRREQEQAEYEELHRLKVN